MLGVLQKLRKATLEGEDLAKKLREKARRGQKLETGPEASLTLLLCSWLTWKEKLPAW